MTATDIVSIIDANRDGMTTAQVAAAAGLKMTRASSRLSKLRMYGLISGRPQGGQRGNHILWLPKERRR